MRLITLKETGDGPDRAVAARMQAQGQLRWVILAVDPAWWDKPMADYPEDMIARIGKEEGWVAGRSLTPADLPQYLTWNRTRAFDRALKGAPEVPPSRSGPTLEAPDGVPANPDPDRPDRLEWLQARPSPWGGMTTTRFSTGRPPIISYPD